MRHKPTATYVGLTIIMSQPSRHDKNELLSSRAGYFFSKRCLSPEFNRYQCDIRTLDTLDEGYLDGTKVVLLLGERALHEVAGYKDYTIGEQRGCKLSVEKYPTFHFIATFSPQDALDIQDWEGKYNTEYIEYQQEQQSIREDEESTGKAKGVTARSNFGWWIQQDVKKAKNILRFGESYYTKDQSEFIIWPSRDNVVDFLRSKVGASLYLDIETDFDYNITCIGVAWDYRSVMVIPCLLWDYSRAYSNLGSIFQALVGALNRNEVVCHNAMYDLFILAWKYKVPIGRAIYDTMLAHHRSYPDIEKSLGHCMSHLLYEPYHKDTSVFNPDNEYQARQLWKYNANDVRATALIRAELDSRSEKIQGLRQSISQVNSSIRPDIINSLQGILFDDTVRKSIIAENDALCNHYLRAIKILTGGIDVLPTSSKSCVNYFHGQLDYKVVKRSKKTGAPSLGEGELYKLMLKLKDRQLENPVLDLVIAFRRKIKSSGMLKIIPWDRNFLHGPKKHPVYMELKQS